MTETQRLKRLIHTQAHEVFVLLDTTSRPMPGSKSCAPVTASRAGLGAMIAATDTCGRPFSEVAPLVANWNHPANQNTLAGCAGRGKMCADKAVALCAGKEFMKKINFNFRIAPPMDLAAPRELLQYKELGTLKSKNQKKQALSGEFKVEVPFKKNPLGGNSFGIFIMVKECKVANPAKPKADYETTLAAKEARMHRSGAGAMNLLIAITAASRGAPAMEIVSQNMAVA